MGLIFTVLFSLCAQDIKAAADICSSTLRLHIIANSNSTQDQNVKLAVRDEVLKSDQILFPDTSDFDKAVEITAERLEDIEDTVNSFLAGKNIGYRCRCSLEKFSFDTRQYQGFALPEGEYTALTVRLGEAEGENWWCVVYPALCSRSCGEIALENSDDFIKTDRITPRFKVVEIFEDIKGMLADSDVPHYTH